MCLEGVVCVCVCKMTTLGLQRLHAAQHSDCLTGNPASTAWFTVLLLRLESTRSEQTRYLGMCTSDKTGGQHAMPCHAMPCQIRSIRISKTEARLGCSSEYCGNHHH